jgi:hypothetical protein
MKRAFDILACGAVAALIVALGAIALLALAARHATQQLERDELLLAPQLSKGLADIGSVEKSASDLEEATYASEGSIANLADTVNGIASDLSRHEAAELQEAQGMSRKLDILLGHADADVQTLGDTERATTAAINQIADDAHASLASSQAAMNAAAADLADPALKDSFAKLDTTMQYAAAGTTSGAHALAKADEGITYEVGQLEKPVKKIVLLWHGVLDAVGRVLVR